MNRSLRPLCMTLAAVAAMAVPAVESAGQTMFQDQTTARLPGPNNDYTNQATIGDIDGDGDLDLLLANGGNFFSQGPPQIMRVLINDGTGVFTDESAARTGNLAGTYRGVELGDADGDGDLDIILAHDFNELPALLINDGNGFFTDGTSQLPQITLGSSRAQFGDIDNDGDLDIYINSGGANRFGCGQNRIYINDGDGNFTDETNERHPLGNVCEPMDVLFVDINDDFSLDVRTASTGNNDSKLYRNNGEGFFTDQSGAFPSDSNSYSYDAGDIDNDGDMDFYGANAGTGNQGLLVENGILEGIGFVNISSQLIPNPNVDDNDSKFLDWDNDGDLDLIVARLGGTSERTYENDGTGVFTEVTNIIPGISNSSLDIMVGDVNNDGRYDVLTAQGESGSFINRLYINVNGPVDTTPPTIHKTEQLDDTDDTTGPYVVRVLITDSHSSDRNFFDKGVTLHYSVDDGDEQSVAMRYSGGTVYRGEIPGQPGGVVSYHVTALDYNDNLGTGETLSFTIGDDTVEIVSSDPPNNAIDARQPSNPDGSNPDGWSSIAITFSGDVSTLVPADFTVSEEGGDGIVPTITSVTDQGGNTVLVELDSFIEPGAWTTFTHDASGTSTRLGYLPGDVNSDQVSTVGDVLALIDAINGVELPEYSTDIDRSGETGAGDVLREIDLLNGADQLDVWNFETLP